jgi:hypothetical protein
MPQKTRSITVAATTVKVNDRPGSDCGSRRFPGSITREAKRRRIRDTRENRYFACNIERGVFESSNCVSFPQSRRNHVWPA